MPHRNKIIDSDAHFVVNAITRQIENKTPSKITLMQNDHNSERFTFTLPRFIEGHDMLEVSKAEVHYKNGDSAGIYEMKDIAIDAKDDSKVTCSWLLSRNATRNAGSLSFQLKFSCLGSDGITVEYAWHTALFSTMNVSAGLDNSETVAEENVDILEQWRQEFIQKEEKNTAGGVAGLDENGMIHADQIPADVSIVVDEYLDENSTNPVQNKAIHKVVTQLVDSKMSHAQFAPHEEQINKNTSDISGIRATLGGCLIGGGRTSETEIVFHSNDMPSKLKLSAVSQKYVDDKIGDINAAFDELHAYAQSLINGGGN